MHRAAYNSRSFLKWGITYRENYNQQSTQNLWFSVTFALNSLETIKLVEYKHRKIQPRNSNKQLNRQPDTIC